MRPGDRVAVIGCGGVGLSAVMARRAAGAEPIVAVDVEPRRSSGARGRSARPAAVPGGLARGDGGARSREATGGGVDYAIEATGRPEAMLAAFLSTRNRGAAVLMGIPREDAVLPLPARSIPRMERRVSGSLYGSARPDRDFPVILDIYRRGRLPLDRLITHRLPLERIGEAFELLRTGAPCER